jgi:hypothetical protein
MNVYFHMQRLDKNVVYSLVGCSCITVDFGKLYIKMKTVAFMFSSFANCIFACLCGTDLLFYFILPPHKGFSCDTCGQCTVLGQVLVKAPSRTLNISVSLDCVELLSINISLDCVHFLYFYSCISL